MDEKQAEKLKNLGKNLDTIRTLLKFSQREMAETFNLKLSTYKTYEYGKSEPGIISMFYISKKVGFSIEDLLTTEIKMEQTTSDRIINHMLRPQK